MRRLYVVVLVLGAIVGALLLGGAFRTNFVELFVDKMVARGFDEKAAFDILLYGPTTGPIYKGFLFEIAEKRGMDIDKVKAAHAQDWWASLDKKEFKKNPEVALERYVQTIMSKDVQRI